jgi:hypothetical protein
MLLKSHLRYNNQIKGNETISPLNLTINLNLNERRSAGSKKSNEQAQLKSLADSKAVSILNFYMYSEVISERCLLRSKDKLYEKTCDDRVAAEKK